LGYNFILGIFMQALLIDAQGAGSVGRAVVEWIPAGLRSVAGVFEQEKVDYEFAIIEEFLKNKKKFKDYKSYFISAMSSDLPAVRAASKLIKDSERNLILGGPVTFDKNSLLDLQADIAVIGEGERSISRLIEAGLKDGELPNRKDLSNIRGIAYRKNGAVEINPKDQLLSKEELNSFNPSTSVVAKYPLYEYAGIAVEILRGCSNFHRAKDYHGRRCPPRCNNCRSEDLEARLKCPVDVPAGCGFCSVGGLYGPPRSREQELILEEIRRLIEIGVKKISFIVPDPLDYKREELVAPVPLTDPAKPEPNYEELDKLCSSIWDLDEVARGDVMVTIRDVKATLVTERSAELLKKYFSSSIIGLGCESGSEEHCNKLGRGYSPREVEKAVKILNSKGILPKINLIVGLPGQDEETVKETLKFMKRIENKVLYFDAARFESLPATAFENCPSDWGPIKDDKVKKIFEKVNAVHERHIQGLLGERWKVLIGVYKGDIVKEEKKDYQRGPKRKFRKLARVVGYPLSAARDLSLMATVVRITNPSPELKTGDLKEVEITGYSLQGFRVIPDGKIIE
jgi:radical SAM superfamily enzyme YgiQ (UPF0313 family)